MFSILDDVKVGFLVESDESILYVNRTYGILLGYEEPRDLLGRHLSLVLAEDDAPRLLGFSQTRTRHEPAPESYFFSARSIDGTPVQLHASVTTSRIDEKVFITTIVSPASHVIFERAPRPLSAREDGVMKMILAGKRIKEIALALQLSPKTVATHRHRILMKLGLSDNRELFQYAIRHGLVDWK